MKRKIIEKNLEKRLSVMKKVVLLQPQSKAIEFFFKAGPVVQLG